MVSMRSRQVWDGNFGIWLFKTDFMPMINKPQRTHSSQRQCLCRFRDSISLQQAATQPFHNNVSISFLNFPCCEPKRFMGSFRKIFHKRLCNERQFLYSDSSDLKTLWKILQIIVTIWANSHLSCQKRLGSTCKGLRAFGSMSEGLNK